MLRPGVFLQDRYEILEQIGSGGMSVVYKAKCHKLNRLVAVKVLNEEFSNDANFVRKFKLEAQAAAGLTHPNIVSIYDVVDEGKLHYIIMELVEGITLKSYIASKGFLEIRESVGIAIQVAQGIAAAHGQHLIHRDIKPQNMLISRDGKVKVADFGIARAVSAQTLNSAAMGSVHYISPEQAKGELSDKRSDIYSLGVTIYEMVTGRVPFDGDNTVAIALAHLENAVVPPHVYRPDIPSELEHIILKCMEKKPERRYQDVADVIADLRRVLAQPEDAVPVPAPADSASQDEKKPQKVNGGTRKMSDEELSRIQKAAEQRKKAREQRKADNPARAGEEQPEEPGGKGGVSLQIERLLAGAGIAAAVVIVAVLVVVFARLGGIFRAGSGFFGQEGSETGTQEESSSLSDTEVYMPDVLGLSESLADAKLSESLLNMKCTYRYSDEVEKGKILDQEPKAGEIVPKWSNVQVTVSNGTDKMDLSELGLESLTGEEAARLLRAKNLQVVTEEQESEETGAGMVISYRPQQIAEGGTVTLTVSKGPHVEKVTIPQLSGLDESEAIALLAEAGLAPGTTETEHSATVPRGFIIRQSGGDENGEIEVGGKVNYVVSSGPEVQETETAKQRRYVASFKAVYDLTNLIGPGAGSTSVTVSVRLHQKQNGEDVYKQLMEPMTIKGDTRLPMDYTSIESLTGTDEGEVEVVDVNSGEVLKSYPLTFFPMD